MSITRYMTPEHTKSNPVLNYLIAALLATSSATYGSTIMYNMELRRAFQPQPYTIVLDYPFFLRWGSVFQGALDSEEDGLHVQSFQGGLLTMRYSHCPWWIESAFGFGVERHGHLDHDELEHCIDKEERTYNTSKLVNASLRKFGKSGRVGGLDDIVLDLGYDISVQDINMLNIYGLVGIPTRPPNSEGRGIGSGHVNIGVGFDGILGNYLGKHQQSTWSLIVNGRLRHVLPRDVHDDVHDDVEQISVTPAHQTLRLNDSEVTILDFNTIRDHPGTFLDLLAGLRLTWGAHFFEVGYSPMISFGGHSEHLQTTFVDPARTRHTGYLNYTYSTFLHEVPFLITIGASFGSSRTADNELHEHSTLASFWFGTGISF
jgi:hypothetical protein